MLPSDDSEDKGNGVTWDAAARIQVQTWVQWYEENKTYKSIAANTDGETIEGKLCERAWRPPIIVRRRRTGSVGGYILRVGDTALILLRLCRSLTLTCSCISADAPYSRPCALAADSVGQDQTEVQDLERATSAPPTKRKRSPETEDDAEEEDEEEDVEHDGVGEEQEDVDEEEMAKKRKRTEKNRNKKKGKGKANK